MAHSVPDSCRSAEQGSSISANPISTDSDPDPTQLPSSDIAGPLGHVLHPADVGQSQRPPQVNGMFVSISQSCNTLILVLESYLCYLQIGSATPQTQTRLEEVLTVSNLSRNWPANSSSLDGEST